MVNKPAAPLAIAILTISDTRTARNDSSGDYLAQSITENGCQQWMRDLVPDDIYQVRAVLSTWIADAACQTIITTGGTGIALRDTTPEAVRPLLDIEIEGFGELFRMLSYEDVGNIAIHSRALAGIANNTLLVCLPGSKPAVQLAWEKILKSQLNASFKPCNLAQRFL